MRYKKPHLTYFSNLSKDSIEHHETNFRRDLELRLLAFLIQNVGRRIVAVLSSYERFENICKIIKLHSFCFNVIRISSVMRLQSQPPFSCLCCKVGVVLRLNIAVRVANSFYQTL